MQKQTEEQADGVTPRELRLTREMHLSRIDTVIAEMRATIIQVALDDPMAAAFGLHDAKQVLAGVESALTRPDDA